MTENTKTIAKNTGWYGLENIVNAVITLFTSIAIARYLGPSKNGYIVYVSYIASVVAGLGGVGVPATTRKYMAEFFGMGDRGTARYIYLRTLLLQAGLATLATGGLLIWVLGDANPNYKLAAALLVLSIWPEWSTTSRQWPIRQPNRCRQMCPPPSLQLSPTSFWSGNGRSSLGRSRCRPRCAPHASRGFSCAFFPTLKRVLAWGTTHVQPPELARRMMKFSFQSVASMLVNQIVWGRSEVILLKILSTDIRQVAFYSAAFSMAEQLLMGAIIFGAAELTDLPDIGSKYFERDNFQPSPERSAPTQACRRRSWKEISSCAWPKNKGVEHGLFPKRARAST